jgi:hypothetical protein
MLCGSAIEAIRRTVWPKRVSVRPQWCALAQASMPMTQGGRFAKNTATGAQRSCLRRTALPRSSTPWSWKMFLAKSIPTVVIFIVDAPIQLSGNQHFHFGTSMPFRVGASIP